MSKKHPRRWAIVHSAISFERCALPGRFIIPLLSSRQR